MTTFSAIKLGITIFAVTISLILGALVYKNNSKNLTNRLFAALSLITALWMFVMYLAPNSSLMPANLFLIRLSIVLAVPQSLFIFLISKTLLTGRLQFKRLWQMILFALTPLIIVWNLTPYVFSDIQLVNGTPRPIVQPGILIFVVFAVGMVIGAIYSLIKEYKRSSDLSRQQIKLVLFGSVLMFGLIITTILVPATVFGSDFFVPFSPLYVLIFLFFTSYAIIRHKLFDIRIFVLRAVSFLLALAVLAGGYAFVLLAIIKQLLGLQFDATISAVSIVVALLILTTFRPLESFFRRLTNRIFHASHYNPDELLAQLNEAVKRTVDLEKMTQETLDLLTKQIGLAKASWLLIDNHKIVGQHSLGFNFNEAGMKELEEMLHTQEAYEGQLAIIFDNLEESPTKDILRKHDISVIMPIMVEDAEIATLILGNKLSGEIYFTPDLNLLNVFASEAGFAIQNARLYENIKNLSEAKSKFISVVSHQLRTPVSALKWTLESLKAQTNADSRRTDADVGNKISELVSDAYKSSTFLGGQLDDIIVALDIYDRKLTLNKTTCSLPEMIEPLVKNLSEFIIPKRLVIKTDWEKGAEKISADADKLKKILLILIRNAVVYSRPDGEIKISSKLDIENEKPTGVVIRVADKGIGIEAEEGKYVFDQFYRGEKARTTMPDGLGLGLFIVKSFTEAHGGSVWFYSAGRDKGTEFYVSLPADGN